MTSTPAPSPPSDAALEAMVYAAAALQDLAIPPEWRGDVLFHLKTIMTAARFVEAYPLDDELESASVFGA